MVYETKWESVRHVEDCGGQPSLRKNCTKLPLDNQIKHGLGKAQLVAV